MGKPKYWNSMFAEKVIKAYNSGELNTDEGSIRKWFDEYNAPLGTSDKDVDNIRGILRYYDAGHRPPCMEL